MKIALVSQEYPPETAKGGIGSQTYAKAHGLAALGHKVIVISRSIDEGRHEISDNNVTVIRLPGMEHQLPDMTEAVQWLSNSMAVAAEIDALNKKIILDIIEFPEWAAEGYVYLLNRTPGNSVPVVIQLHGPLVMFGHRLNWPDRESIFFKVGTHMEATCVQLADAIYSSSECSARWIIDYYKPSVINIPIIHTGVDTETFSNKNIQKYERLTIAFAGKLVPNKGVEELVESASYLSKEFEGLRLNLLGRGEESFIIKLKEKASKSGAEDLLNFVGFVNKEDLPGELSKAHLFAAPSYYEGGPGFVYLEAMACELPVIGCSGSGVEEIIEDGVNGYLVKPRNVQSLTEALRKILNDESKMKEMGGQAREYVVCEAHTKHCVKQVELFYYSVLQKIKDVAE